MISNRQPVSRLRLAEWLTERSGLRALAYSVPAHANSLPYLLGGITFVGFLILFVTGIYLAQFYHPHPLDAHDSVVFILTQAGPERGGEREPSAERVRVDRSTRGGVAIGAGLIATVAAVAGLWLILRGSKPREA